MIDFRKVIQGVEVLHQAGSMDRRISRIQTNSKKISKDDVFVALKGRGTDGHKYIDEAIGLGATVIVCNEDYIAQHKDGDVTFISVNDTRKILHRLIENFYEHPTEKFWLVGITGTNGKTSVSIMVERIYQKLGYRTGVIGTIDNYLLGKPMNSVKTTPTTPDCCELGALMNTYKEKQVDKVIMEVSSMSLKMHRVDSCAFDVAVFTNLSPEHLDDHVTMDDYKKSKMKLFEFAPRAVINMDDPNSEDFIKINSNVITYGIEKDADIVARNVKYTEKNVTFDVVIKGDFIYSITLSIPSRFAVYNALTAIGICMWDKNIDLSDACKILSEEYIIPGRYEVIDLKNNIEAIIDYAHTPVALENLLKAVRNNPAFNNIITVFGCGGNRDTSKRPRMGEIGQTYSDTVIVTSDNPRYEDPEKIIDDIMRGVKGGKNNVIRISDRRAAIRKAYEIAKQGDVIVIAGKGHETVQIVKGKDIHFNDKEEILIVDSENER